MLIIRLVRKVCTNSNFVVLGAPMATQHQTPGGYRGQWSNVGAGHQHPAAAAVGAAYQPYQRYAASAAAQSQQPPAAAQPPQPQQQPISYSSAAANYNNTNSVSTLILV